MVGAFSAWDRMKPRTVYEKAVQDLTEAARRLARLDQHFRQASFAEFKMLMFDDELLKRYGLPKSMVERALIKVYETVVLGQQRRRLLQDHDGFNELGRVLINRREFGDRRSMSA